MTPVHSRALRAALVMIAAPGVLALGAFLQPAGASGPPVVATPSAGPAPTVVTPAPGADPVATAPVPAVVTPSPGADPVRPTPAPGPAPTAPAAQPDGAGSIRVDAGGGPVDEDADTTWLLLGGTGGALVLGGAAIGLVRRRAA